MINLIPTSAKKSLIKEYWLRAITVWFFLWTVALLLGIFIMIPSYVLINSQVSAYKDWAESATEKKTSYEALAKDLERSGKWAKLIKDNSELPRISKYIALFRSLEGSGVTVSNISIVYGDKGLEPIIIIGTATSRQALAAFRDNVLAQDSVKSVDLPLSNLAKDRDIPFEISVTIDNEKKP
jgi:hypothetical protein